MTTRQVIFVRGGKTSDIVVWRFFHFHPVTAVNVGIVKLVYFDYPEGKMKIWNSWTPKQGKAPTARPDMETDIAPAIHIRFADGSIDTSEKRPSALGVYDFIKKQAAGSVASLQIFSHGDYDGPIIWADSFENVDKSNFTLDRDPYDTEFRRRDFFGKNPLGGTEGTKFANAFAPGALVKIWGCTEDEKYRRLIRNYNNLSSNKENDAKRLVILENYLDILDVTYALLMARLLKQTVWAAPIGWGTNPWGDQPYKGSFPPNLTRELWWRVPAFVSSYRRFYTNLLGAKLDATHYVGFNQSWFISSRAKLKTP